MPKTTKKLSEKQKMLSGALYCANDPELQSLMLHCRQVLSSFNNISNIDLAFKMKLLSKLFGKMGENCFIQPTFRCDYGCNIEVGDNFFANYDCIFLDVNKIKIGDNVFFAPRVCIYTAGHPIDKEVRFIQLEYGYPVTIGNDVWVGGNVVINPGVTIGNNVVIGSGSVVTHDIPSDSVAAGVPCKVIRKITEEDKAYWAKQKDAYFNS